MIRHNLIKNCPVKLEDVDNMISIFGPSIAALKGKTVRKKSPPVKSPDYIKMPPELENIKKRIEIEADVIYINGVMFWFTMSRKLDLLTIERVKSRDTQVVLKAMASVVSLYSSKGMRIQSLYVDPEFGTQAFTEPLLKEGIKVNVASAKEHVAGIERKTRVVKARVRARWSVLPYKKIPVIMTVEMVKDVITWLNSFPQSHH